MPYLDTLNEGRRRLLNNTDIDTFSRGSIARELLEAVSQESRQAYTYLDSKVANILVTNATGEYLDALGKLVGVERNSGARGFGESQFYLDSDFSVTVQELQDEVNEDEIVFPAGTTVRDKSGNISYTTTEPATITNDGTTVPIVATGTGSDYNVATGELTEYDLSISDYRSIEDFILVRNNAPIDNGSDTESDENYRYRITHAFQNNAKGNLMSVRLACLSVPGVSDIYLRNFEPGIGTFSVYVISESPIASKGLLEGVQEAINQTASVGVRGIATVPDYEAIHLGLVFIFEEGTSPKDKDRESLQIRRAVIDYINNLDVGEGLVINRVIDIAYNTSGSLKDVSIEQFGRGKYNHEEGIIDSYQPLIITNQEADRNTKFVTNKRLVEECYKE